MSILTTTIGAYPKPAGTPIPDWFEGGVATYKDNPTGAWRSAIDAMGADAETLIAKATRAVITDQVQAGIDVPTDGEVRRDNYIYYHCRHLEGIDFEHLSDKSFRGGAESGAMPTIRSPVRARAPFLTGEWRAAQSFTDRPVKVTMPGSLTVADTLADEHYADKQRLGADFADALNQEVLALSEAGCKHIQIDEPVFVRALEDAHAFGFDNLERAFHGCAGGVTKTVHMCCSYPDRLDNPNYPKGPPESYARLADAIEASAIMAVSIEDGHGSIDLDVLERFRTTTVLLGVVAIGRSRVETVDEIRARLEAALEHIDPERLVAAPDCGLGLLGRDLSRRKLRNLCRAAHSLP